MEDLKNLSAERSLEIIERSIEQSRRDIERGSWKYMLLWGVSVCVVALANGHIWMHYDVGPASNMIWALMGVVALIDLKMRRSGPRRPVSFLNKNITYVWSSFGYVLGAMGLTLGLLYLLPSPDNSCLLKASSPGAATVVQFPLTCIIVAQQAGSGLQLPCRWCRQRAVVGVFRSVGDDSVGSGVGACADSSRDSHETKGKGGVSLCLTNWTRCCTAS